MYDEVDGTEINDDECLALCDNSRVYVIGAEWKPAASSPVPSPVVSSATTAVSKPVTATSFDASPVSSVIINEAEGSGEMSESSIGGYDNWMETDIDIITSTPNTKDPSEEKPAKQVQDEIVVPEQEKEAGETSQGYVRKRSSLGELEGSEIKKKKVDDEKPTDSPWSKLMRPEFPHAKQKGFKIYTKDEIRNCKYEGEQSRRKFWNEKAEQLCSHSETANLSKNKIGGIIDTAWTLRRTSLFRDEARRLDQNEEELFPDDTSASWKRGSGKQKAKTIGNNIEKMELAHLLVIEKDKELQNIKARLKKCTREERDLIEKEYKKTLSEFDVAYTKLKLAQEALSKALTHKKEIFDKRLKEKNEREFKSD
ncbi:Hypothetical predicted protein [Paramuricea clavata]|uniref:Uncharacterized protein n=1 Tax=Paramuricea clavata TaxID=317549 RepID=A0A6S7IKB6_PARCT|nr:Hypothetical predicted protein [Paramuricea clavata]